MTSENNSLLLNLQEVDKTTGEVVKLDVNSTSTVQPVALMRLGLFVPTLKSMKRRGEPAGRYLLTRETPLQVLYASSIRGLPRSVHSLSFATAWACWKAASCREATQRACSSLSSGDCRSASA